MRNKFITAQEAAAMIHDGDFLMVGGFMGHGSPDSIIQALVDSDVKDLVVACFRFIADFKDEVPGASAMDCGNYLDMNLPMANYWGKRYSELLETAGADRFVYPK